MTNEQVIAAWINGKSARSANGNLSTDGDRLKSYALTIGFTTLSRAKVAIDYTARSGRFYSMTTSSHVGMASAQADGLFAPPLKAIWTS